MNTAIDNCIEYFESQSKRNGDFADWVHNGIVFTNAEARQFMELVSKLEAPNFNLSVQAAVQIAEIIRQKLLAEYEHKAESWKAEKPL